MPVDCKRIQEALLHYLEGEMMEEWSSLDMEAHLRACSDCRERAESIRTLSRLLRELPKHHFSLEGKGGGEAVPFLITLPRKKPDADLGRKILASVREEVRGGRPANQRGSIFKLIRSVAAAAVVTALLSGLGYRAVGSSDDFCKNRDIQITLGKSLYTHSLKSDETTGGEDK